LTLEQARAHLPRLRQAAGEMTRLLR
jgi:hypothetical protein